jgi:hypothetical protein
VQHESQVSVIFSVPASGERPTAFRRALVTAVRDAIATAAMAGRLDTARAEEAFRALPIEESCP